MPRTEQKIDELASEGEHMTDALEQVLDIADEQGAVTWGDVNDELSSGEWGRLIEKGLLVDAGEGFVVDDPDGVREALAEADPVSMDEYDTGWTSYDKGAAGIVLVLFVGYIFPPVRTAVGSNVDTLFGPVESLLPFYLVILVLALLTGLHSAIMQDNLMNPEIMSAYREKTQALKQRREAAKERGDEEELEQIQDQQVEMMTDNLGVFKAQFRPMVWIMVLVIPVFLWLYWIVRDVGVTIASPVIVFPYAGEISSWTTGLVGPLQAWIVWYFVCSMAFGQIMRKALNVQTGAS
jgi:uncharacterized membrane protein (DUF106 family)